LLDPCPVTPFSLSQGDQGGEESLEVFGDSTAEFRPVVQLPEKKNVNGEEDERVAFSGGNGGRTAALSPVGAPRLHGTYLFRSNAL